MYVAVNIVLLPSFRNCSEVPFSTLPSYNASAGAQQAKAKAEAEAQSNAQSAAIL